MKREASMISQRYLLVETLSGINSTGMIFFVWEEGIATKPQIYLQ